MDKLVGMGYDKNEVELCYAVLTYNVELLKKHLGLKTNPDVFIGEITYQPMLHSIQVNVIMHCISVIL